MSAEEELDAVESPPEMIKLVSAEGDEFWVDKRAAMVSGTIKSMLTGPGECPAEPANRA
jgi:transcription elongation factor B subunit 1